MTQIFCLYIRGQIVRFILQWIGEPINATVVTGTSATNHAHSLVGSKRRAVLVRQFAPRFRRVRSASSRVIFISRLLLRSWSRWSSESYDSLARVAEIKNPNKERDAICESTFAEVTFESNSRAVRTPWHWLSGRGKGKMDDCWYFLAMKQHMVYVSF